MGKTFVSARAEAQKCAVGCRYYAENAQRFLTDEQVSTNATRSYIRYQPMGAVLAVMPWNFPFWQVFRFAAPALMAGNVGLLKHASIVQGVARAMEEMVLAAGGPEGLFQNLAIKSEAVADIIAHHARRSRSQGLDGHAQALLFGQRGHRLPRSLQHQG